VQSGGVGANGERTTPPAARKDKKEEVRIGERVQFQSSASKIVGDTVWLQKLAKVFSIFFNELRNNGATIQGTQTSPLTTPVLALPTVPTVTPGTQDITVKKNQTVTLAAGAYRTITVEKGGTLKLTGGLYQVQSVDIRGDADVLFRAASELRVKNELDTDQKTYFGPDPAVPGLRAKDIKVIATGGDDRGRRHDDDDNDPELGPTVVQFGHHNTVKVNVYAPNGTVWVKHDSDATGAFIGQKVRIGHDATLALDSGFGN
ncbi:MAG: hypothetical protein NTZ05_03540, partial [Chloroflexi bacterium]|nr:hypothetical protein [Chloroflexota bacterium]